MKPRFKAMTVQPQGAEKEAGTSSLLLVLVESCAHPVCSLLLTELETETYRPQATTLPTKPWVIPPLALAVGSQLLLHLVQNMTERTSLLWKTGTMTILTA